MAVSRAKMLLAASRGRSATLSAAVVAARAATLAQITLPAIRTAPIHTARRETGHGGMPYFWEVINESVDCAESISHYIQHSHAQFDTLYRDMSEALDNQPFVLFHVVESWPPKGKTKKAIYPSIEDFGVGKFIFVDRQGGDPGGAGHIALTLFMPCSMSCNEFLQDFISFRPGSNVKPPLYLYPGLNVDEPLHFTHSKRVPVRSGKWYTHDEELGLFLGKAAPTTVGAGGSLFLFPILLSQMSLIADVFLKNINAILSQQKHYRIAPGVVTHDKEEPDSTVIPMSAYNCIDPVLAVLGLRIAAPPDSSVQMVMRAIIDCFLGRNAHKSILAATAIQQISGLRSGAAALQSSGPDAATAASTSEPTASGETQEREQQSTAQSNRWR